MSNFNPAAKAGYTRTGKSLKSVRRYYAMLNQQRTKSPEDDKLSKRIAVELKTQHDANEKRSKRDVGLPLLADTVTERSSLPSGVMISPKETGPVFINSPPPAPKPLSPDSTFGKSLKSHKTIAGAAPDGTATVGPSLRTKLIYFILGLVIGILIGAVTCLLISKYATKTQPIIMPPTPEAPIRPPVRPPLPQPPPIRPPPNIG